MRENNEQEHFEEAAYRVWKQGGNMDRVDRQASDNDFEQGRSPEATIRRELKRQHVNQFCPDCGCRVYSGGCVNCNEENYL